MRSFAALIDTMTLSRNNWKLKLNNFELDLYIWTTQFAELKTRKISLEIEPSTLVYNYNIYRMNFSWRRHHKSNNRKLRHTFQFIFLEKLLLKPPICLEPSAAVWANRESLLTLSDRTNPRLGCRSVKSYLGAWNSDLVRRWDEPWEESGPANRR